MAQQLVQPLWIHMHAWDALNTFWAQLMWTWLMTKGAAVSLLFAHANTAQPTLSQEERRGGGGRGAEGPGLTMPLTSLDT